MASSNIGIRHWWRLYESMLNWCTSIEALSGRIVQILDVGGGWFPEDIHLFSPEKLREAVQIIPEFLPNVKRLFFEPGKALAQPSMAVAMQVLEVRDTEAGIQDIVVDGSIAELPMYAFYPHRILFKENSHWRPLGRGKSRLLGRLCMEHDIVASNIDLPKTTRPGDVLIFCDAGAYDRSMSYVFGRG